MNLLHFSYLLVYRFSLACCRAVCFVALVIILVENILAALFSGYGGVVFLDIVLIFLHFSSSLVSATSYADDIAHT